MIFCERKDCQYNDDGACENPEDITISEEGICEDYELFFGDLENTESE